MTDQQMNEEDITLRCKSCSCAIFKIHGGNEVECVECKRASSIMELKKEYYDENKQTITAIRWVWLLCHTFQRHYLSLVP